MLHCIIIIRLHHSDESSAVMCANVDYISEKNIVNMRGVCR